MWDGWNETGLIRLVNYFSGGKKAWEIIITNTLFTQLGVFQCCSSVLKKLNFKWTLPLALHHDLTLLISADSYYHYGQDFLDRLTKGALIFILLFINTEKSRLYVNIDWRLLFPISNYWTCFIFSLI